MARRGVIYHWRHGWIPITPTAALQKAKGNPDLARRYLPGGSRASVSVRSMSDDHLADHLADVGDDESAINSIMRELDRRDRAAAAAQRRTVARNAALAAKRRAADAEYDRKVDEGMDPLEAYAEAFGKDVEKLRREEAISSLRASGYRGRGFDELVRSAFTAHSQQAYLDAEDVTRGHMLSKAGRAADIRPASLFVGPESRARKYASEELLSYWQTHGRLTVDDFKAGLLGGAMRSSGTAAFL